MQRRTRFIPTPKGRGFRPKRLRSPVSEPIDENWGGVTGIDHVQLAAPPGCEAAARRFFGGILGMEELEKPEELKKRGGVWFRCGSQQLHIGVEPDFSPAKKAHPAFRVRDLERLRERLAANGIRVQDDDSLPGAKRFYAKDPFGNRLEFIEWEA